MKVTWFVSNYPHHANSQAGIFYKILAEAMIGKGCELIIVAPTPSTGPVLPMLSSKWKQYASAPELEEYDHLVIHRPRYFTLPGETDSRYAHKRIIAACLKLKLPDARLVHGFGSYPVNVAALQLAQMWDKPFVQTFIGSDVNDYPYRGAHQRKLFEELAKESQRVLAVSNNLCDKIKELSGVDATKVVMPISESPKITQTREEIRVTFGLDPNAFVVLFAGSLIHEKGINELLEAFNDWSFSDSQLILAGPDPNQIQVPESVLKAGVVQHDSLLTLMTACDVLVLPSHNEGIPGVIKEAGQMGLPVLATRAGGIPEILDESTGYFAELRNVESLRTQLHAIKNNLPEARLKADQLKIRIEQEFEGAAVAKKLVDIYAEVISTYRR